jgi:translation initiation factor 5B
MIITGLAQKFLEENLKLNISGPAKGIVLEVKEDKGLGRCIDAIIYDGSLKTSDNIIIGTMNEPIKARIRALLMPEALIDMRDKKSRFKAVKEIIAATGIKISSPDFTEEIVAGMPIHGIRESDEEEIKKEIKKQIQEVAFDIDKKGIIVKADTIGSLEALIKLLREQDIKIRRANIGNITKKDISDAETSHEEDTLHSVILGFNIKQEKSTDKVKIIVKDIIYSLLDEYKLWAEKVKADIEAKELQTITRPAKIEVLQNCIFRQSGPCIAGIEIIEGQIKTGTTIIDKQGNKIDILKSMQSENRNITEAEKGRQVAASFPNIIAAKKITEGETYYSDITEHDFKKLKKLTKHLTKLELEILKEIVAIKRKQNPVWGV